ncbi:GPW/gp25 family protein [Brevundimonas sp. UBA7664]|uniref:GPW/gp25 family protein n=1 Tax=Brevundimonas sp. UBA7664 TaxID=1946141 RepID=UPI0025BC80F7|nr:GPW/gp25 family protein [Brevundimonas sp. UBA7664]
MRGMQAGTGKPISGLDHLIQSIADILTTPLGSRVMRRDYGSALPDLIDQPMNGATRMRLFGAVATALQRWEPRIRLTRVWLERGARDGSWILTLAGRRLDVPARSELAAFDFNLTLGANAQPA